MEEIVLVVHRDAVCKRQLEVCKEVKPSLAGVEDCGAKGRNEELCRAVEYFPAWCRSSPAGSLDCVYGYRGSQQRIESVVEALAGN